MRELILIFIGGGLGSVLRALVGRWTLHASFPFATFFVNIVGCLMIGFLISIAHRHLLNIQFRSLLAVGFCGGFTTFSTFSNESLQQLKSGQLLHFALYAGATFVGCLLAVWLGDFLGQRIP